MQNSDLSPDEAKGILRRSLLLSVPGFDYVNDIPAEYMHSVCLCIVKKIVELCFNVGDKRFRVTKRKLSDPASFNKLMTQVKVPKEFSRRARELDFAVYKAQEFRNLLLFFFPLVIACIEKRQKERHLWLLLAYMIRACVMPSKQYID